MDLNLGSTFNTLLLGQANYQGAANNAVWSWGAMQGVRQNAGNGAYVVQVG